MRVALQSLRRLGRAMGRGYDRLSRIGLDHATPVHLVDRIVYSNFVFLVATLVNGFAAIDNVIKEYRFLIVGNLIYQFAALLGFFLNWRRRYLAARFWFIFIALANIVLEAAVQGPELQMEHLLLGAAVLAFSMFHPLERRYAAFFVGVCLTSYLILLNRSDPLLPMDPDSGRYTSTDLLVNQLSYTALILFSLLGISNAYARATRIVDEQRSQLFEQSRLSALGAVACSVAHEINTPLMAMNIYLEELETNFAKTPDRTDDYQAVEKLGSLSGRIAAIVRGFKRISYSDADDPLTEISLEELLKPAIDIAKGLVKPLGISLQVSLHDPNCRVTCHVVAMSQVMLNLLTNSVDAVACLQPDGRWIHVASQAEGRRIVISVTDAGTIASQPVRTRLFEAFFTTKPLGKGSGLGLHISRRAVEHHGGQLYFDANSQNTRFVIDLPQHPEAQRSEGTAGGRSAA